MIDRLPVVGGPGDRDRDEEGHQQPGPAIERRRPRLLEGAGRRQRLEDVAGLVEDEAEHQRDHERRGRGDDARDGVGGERPPAAGKPGGERPHRLRVDRGDDRDRVHDRHHDQDAQVLRQRQRVDEAAHHQRHEQHRQEHQPGDQDDVVRGQRPARCRQAGEAELDEGVAAPGVVARALEHAAADEVAERILQRRQLRVEDLARMRHQPRIAAAVELVQGSGIEELGELVDPIADLGQGAPMLVDVAAEGVRGLPALHMAVEGDAARPAVLDGVGGLAQPGLVDVHGAQHAAHLRHRLGRRRVLRVAQEAAQLAHLPGDVAHVLEPALDAGVDLAEPGKVRQQRGEEQGREQRAGQGARVGRHRAGVDQRHQDARVDRADAAAEDDEEAEHRDHVAAACRPVAPEGGGRASGARILARFVEAVDGVEQHDEPAEEPLNHQCAVGRTGRAHGASPAGIAPACVETMPD